MMAVPKLTAFKFGVLCLCVTSLIVLGVLNRVNIFLIPLKMINEIPGKMTLLSTNTATPVTMVPIPPNIHKVVMPGENIQVGTLEVHIATAVHYAHYPALNGFNLFLNGWARHKSDMEFKCCLLRSVPTGDLEDDIFTEVKAFTYHVYDQWVVDMQNAEFSCSMSAEQIKKIGNANFTHVAFAETSCFEVTNQAMKIVYPKLVNNSVAVCLKLSYGTVNPEKAVEWFEYTKLMGVNKVFSYTFDLDPPIQKVFEYYQNIGFLEAWPLVLARSRFGMERSARRPRYEQQAWTDEVMAANDCKHRLSGYDFVMVIDIDEFIVPKGSMTSYFDILSETLRRNPKAGTFSIDSYVMMLNWGPTRPDAPLFITQYTNRTSFPNYDGADRNLRWAHKPHRTYFVQNNHAWPRQPYVHAKVPQDLFILLHYRSCKPLWKSCMKTKRVTDESLVMYEDKLVDSILGDLVVHDALYNSTGYVRNIERWRESRSKG